MTNEYDNILNEVEKNELSKLADSPVLMNAIKKVLLRGVYFDGTLKAGEKPEPLKNFLLSIISKSMDIAQADKKIANDLKAICMGIQVVEFTFKELEKFRKIDKKAEEKENPAR